MIDYSLALRDYLDFFETLTPAGLEDCARLFHPEVHFKDPFNDVRGIGRLQQVFAHMFATLGEPSFRIRHHALADTTAYVSWTFAFRWPGSSRIRSLEGISLVRFDQAGKVVEHLDYWDPAEQIYSRLPVIGWLLGRLRGKLAAPQA